jgi:hypothetical protein
MMFQMGPVLNEIYALKLAQQRGRALQRESEIEWLLHQGRLRPVRRRGVPLRRLTIWAGERLVAWGMRLEARYARPPTIPITSAPCCPATQ